MPDYTVQDTTSGKTITFQWNGAAPPTDADMEEVFAAAKSQTPAGPEGSAVGRFVSNAWDVLNPVSAAEGIYGAVRHPVDTATNIIKAQVDQGRQAIDLAKQGRYSEAAGHGVAAVLPLVGPAAAQAGEQIGQGDIAGGLGRGAGLLAPVVVPPLVQAARAAVPVGAGARAAEALDQAAATRVADVMAPKIGPNKVRFGNMAAKAAPSIVQDMVESGAPMTREGLQTMVQDKLTEAEAGLDAAANARNAKLVYHTKPILADLQAKLDTLTAETVRSGSVKAGSDVIPAPNLARAASIRQAMAEVKQLGPVASYDSLRLIRQAWDGPAKAVYSPSMTADYLKAQGGKLGAADVTGVLRDKLAGFDPQTAEANRAYSLYRSADDVLTATQEIERTRPKVGRLIMTRLATTLAGEHAAGLGGAAAGFVFAPILDSALSAGITTKLQTARLMAKMATAIRSGDIGMVTSLSVRLKQMSAATLANATSPSGMQSPSIESASPSPTP